MESQSDLFKSMEQEKLERDQSWLQNIISTVPADRFQAVKAITALYRDNSLRTPQFIWFDNPLTMAVYATIMMLVELPSDNQFNTMMPWEWDTEYTVAMQIHNEDVRRFHVDNIPYSWLKLPEWLKLESTVDQMLYSTFWDTYQKNRLLLNRYIEDFFLIKHMYQLLYRRFGRKECHSDEELLNQSQLYFNHILPTMKFQNIFDGMPAWMNFCSMNEAWYEYFLYQRMTDSSHVIDNAAAWLSIAQNCFCWLPFTTTCLLCERPSSIHLSDAPLIQKQLHCDTGPAIEFRDGTTFWALDGIVVNEQIILHPQTQSIEQIRHETNEEVRRLRIERYGWMNYMSQSHANVVEHSSNAITQTHESLIQLTDMRVLVCACPSTARVYAMQVPERCTTVKQAQHFLSNGLSPRIIGAS